MSISGSQYATYACLGVSGPKPRSMSELVETLEARPTACGGCRWLGGRGNAGCASSVASRRPMADELEEEDSGSEMGREPKQ